MDAYAMTGLMVEMAVVCSLPLLAFAILRIRFKATFSSFLAGVGFFLLFSFALEGIVNMLLLSEGNPFGEFLSRTPLVYLLYSVITTALFEGIGRWLAFKLLLKPELPRINAISYGVGHGGAAAIISTGIPAFVSMSYGAVYNELGAAEFAKSLPEASAEEIQGIIDSVKALAVSDCILDGVNFIACMLMQVAVSIIMLYAVKRELREFFWLSILLQLLFIVPGTLTSLGIISNRYVGIALTVLMCALCMLFAVRVYRAFEEKENLCLTRK